MMINKSIPRLLLVLSMLLITSGDTFGAGVVSSINTSIFNPDHCDCKASGKTFFSVRPAFQLNSPEFLANFHDRLRASGKECNNGVLQLVPFGGRSTNSCGLGQYFMFDCKSRLHITETQQQTTDILAHQLNIFTVGGDNPTTLIQPFESYIEFRPRYTFAGIGLTYKQEFAQFQDGRSFWFLVSTPITYVKTSVNMSEQVIQTGGGVDPNATGAVPNATQAFQQSSWKYGRIEPCSHHKINLGDVTLLLGYELIRHDLCHLDTYFGGLIGTGNKVRGHRVFEPMIGWNHHSGLITGGSAGILFWECEDKNLAVEMDCHGQYLFQRCEVRSFDLKRKPYSRYMQVYENADQAQEALNVSLANPATPATAEVIGTPGINIFTQPLRVHPGLSHVCNLALVYSDCDWQLELGYNFFARQQECVELAKPWQTGPALKSFAFLPINTVPDIGAGSTDSVQIIGNNYGDVNAISFINATSQQIQYDENLIQASDLDLFSATHPGIISHTFYGSGGYRWEHCRHPAFLTGGASYEFSDDNTALSRWMIWIKTGFSF